MKDELALLGIRLAGVQFLVKKHVETKQTNLTKINKQSNSVLVVLVVVFSFSTYLHVRGSCGIHCGTAVSSTSQPGSGLRSQIYSMPLRSQCSGLSESATPGAKYPLPSLLDKGLRKTNVHGTST